MHLDEKGRILTLQVVFHFTKCNFKCTQGNIISVVYDDEWARAEFSSSTVSVAYVIGMGQFVFKYDVNFVRQSLHDKNLLDTSTFACLSVLICMYVCIMHNANEMEWNC